MCSPAVVPHPFPMEKKRRRKNNNDDDKAFNLTYPLSSFFFFLSLALPLCTVRGGLPPRSE
ncbi:hypothetical protein IE53DRAFT_391007 [Violaceomyces palustris]|uniref:Uncharacterized protein n=1 Tax=Violaceomyces palustris TaxID=1673888 RepID=A0ACD0NLZ1_9BASI|nr:hypothetical protein IE53DRAFT_391007 [Violaceomyces palustris]